MSRPTGRALVPVVLALAPWSWFLVRDLEPRLDAVALAWPVVGAVAVLGLCVLTVVLRRRLLAVAAVSWLLASAVVVVGPWRPLDTGTPSVGLRVVTANTFGYHTYPPGVAEELRAQAPDVLVVIEITDEGIPVFSAGWDHQALATNRSGKPGDVAVFTDLPMQAGALPGRLGSQRGVRAEIEGPAGPFVLYAVHLQKPGPAESSVEVGFRTHRQIVDALVDAVDAEELPVVVAGDLNLSDRTSGYRALTDVLDDGARSGWLGPTSLRTRTRPLLARIDHVFMPEGWCSDDGATFTIRGSDHRGVAATVGPCT
jgi:endonuclease/exonuclease/phosphatase (EEP) superfamily protein YafD